MITVYSEDHRLHHPPHELLDGSLITPYEDPQRVEIILDAILRQEIGPVIQPQALLDLDDIRRVHHTDYLSYLEHAYTSWVEAGGNPKAVLPSALAVRWMNRGTKNPLALPGYYSFDTSTPIVAGTYQAALASAHVALTSAEMILQREPSVYALCRPPGHHAGVNLCGGYCFLNNAAIAAEYLIHKGGLSRIAILDIDIHHGNGTQQIFYERSDVLYMSIHIDPQIEYPYFSGFADEEGAGEGFGYNRNIPLPQNADQTLFLSALDQALDDVRKHEPDCVIVSAGFDTYIEDPIGGFTLTPDAYPIMGTRIAQLQLPTLFVQEGGYAIQALGTNVCGFLSGFQNNRSVA